MTPILKTFDLFVGHDLCPIALRSRSKIPIQKAWNENWEERSNRELLKYIPDANIGLLLGKIIDVEGDTKHANQTLLRLIGDCPHPCYRSRKSIHHLFLSPSADLRILKHKGIEFRGYGHQSVLPPSIMDDDLKYEWITFNFNFPEMPTGLRSFYDNILGQRRKGKIVVKPGHMKINCAKCHKKAFVHKQRFELELIAFREIGLYWQCHKCREVDLRDRCRFIRKMVEKNENLGDWRNWVRWQESIGGTCPI